MVSLSTCWNYDPGMDLAAWLDTVKRIGFDAIELDYNITRAHLAALPSLLAEKGLRVSSVHNFCPTPDDGPSTRHKSNYYRLSALDPCERAKAVEWTCRTIDTAVRFDAKVVVIHAGCVDFEDERSTPLRRLYKDGHKGTQAYTAELQRVLENRRKNQPPHRAAVASSLADILPYAQAQNRVLGFESRYYPLEIPDFEEIGFFLDKFHAQGLYYWHDMGHAQMHENLGIQKNLAFVKAYGGRMIGMHIHDMKGTRDHHAPFSGDIDFDSFLPFLRESPLNVFEVKTATAQELSASLKEFRQRMEL